MRKRIVICCGAAPNQRALAGKIAEKFNVVGIVKEKRKAQQDKKSVVSLLYKIYDRLKYSVIYNAWKKLQDHYSATYPEWPEVPVFNTESVNTKATENFIKELAPDLVVISGTSIVKEPLLSIPAYIGMINLHTGLSPYVKGGPNCTYWCIANNDWHLVGNTIMWINAGIDSGNIITTETIDIRQASSLFEAQQQVMEHAHDLYVRAIAYLLNTQPPYISVAQSTFDVSRLFYTKMWTAEKRADLLKNWRKRKRVTLLPAPSTIALPTDNRTK